MCCCLAETNLPLRYLSESVVAMIALLAVLATFIAVVDGFYQAGWITRETIPFLGMLDKSVAVPWHFNAGETTASNTDKSRLTIQIRIAQASYVTTGIVVIISSELFLSLCSCHTHSAASLTISWIDRNDRKVLSAKLAAACFALLLATWYICYNKCKWNSVERGSPNPNLILKSETLTSETLRISVRINLRKMRRRRLRMQRFTRPSLRHRSWNPQSLNSRRQQCTISCAKHSQVPSLRV